MYGDCSGEGRRGLGASGCLHNDEPAGPLEEGLQPGRLGPQPLSSRAAALPVCPVCMWVPTAPRHTLDPPTSALRPRRPTGDALFQSHLSSTPDTKATLSAKSCKSLPIRNNHSGFWIYVSGMRWNSKWNVSKQFFPCSAENLFSEHF